MERIDSWVQQRRLSAVNLQSTKQTVSVISRVGLTALTNVVVNLLCILCSRIRTYRELLIIFFHDKHWYRSEPLFSVEEEDEEEEGDEEATGTTNADFIPLPQQSSQDTAFESNIKKPEYEFLLFNYLLRFVHREGQIGDFARAGLLFLMDVAMSSQEPIVNRLAGDARAPSADQQIMDPINDAALALAEYILDGDFSDVLGAGLGAVYSLLPSKLQFPSRTMVEGSVGNNMVLGSKGSLTEDDLERLDVEKAQARAVGIGDPSSPEFKAQLDHFLKLLEFLQDVFRRNRIHDDVDPSTLVGSAIVQSILDAVRRTFLENVFYPTVLECSDADGSAAAVISYIDIVIRILQDGLLSELFVSFLLNEDNDDFRPRSRTFSLVNLGNGPPQAGSNDKQAKVRRRKSSAMVLLEMENPDSSKPTEYVTSMGRFTLKDLLLSSLRSAFPQTATAALHLLNSLLLHHPNLSTDRLMLVVHDPAATAFPHPVLLAPKPHVKPGSRPHDHDANESESRCPSVDEEQMLFPQTAADPTVPRPETTYSTHEREMGLYLTLISRVDPSHNGDLFSTGYDHYLNDALSAIQSHPAYLLTPGDFDDPNIRRSRKHRLNTDDRLISLLLDGLRKFFSNSPEYNMALTSVIATLAIEPDRSLAGWLTFAYKGQPSNLATTQGEPADGNLSGDDRSVDFYVDEKLAGDANRLPASTLDEHSRPIIHSIYYSLVSKIERYRQFVDNFDQYLLERRQGLLFSENLTDALNLVLDTTGEPVDIAPREHSALKPKAKSRPTAAGAFVSFLTPRRGRTKPPPSEPSSPPKVPGNRNLSASPFGPHYEHTNAVMVEPYIATMPSSGPWSPTKSTKWSEEESDVFSSGWGGKSTSRAQPAEEPPSQKPPFITLSRLLDNIAILEENIKELVAIIHARRSLGIDSVRYL